MWTCSKPICHAAADVVVVLVVVVVAAAADAAAAAAAQCSSGGRSTELWFRAALVSVSEEVRSRCHLKHRFCSMHISESTSNDSIYGDLSYAAAQHHHAAMHHNHVPPPPYSQVQILWINSVHCVCTQESHISGYGDGADNTDEANFSVLSLVRVRWLPSAGACGQ